MLNWTFHHLAGFLPRRSSAAGVRPAPSVPATRLPGPSSAPSAIPNPHLEARRAEALRSLFPKLSNWFAHHYAALSINEINDYLAQSSNVTDLEQRIQLIQQQRHFS